MKKCMLGLALLCVAQTHLAQSILRNDTIQEVVVTGTGTQHLLKDVPVQTEVITQKMLRQYGGKSLEDILAGLTASFAFNEGDMGSQMQLNGLGNSYILILIDGKRIHGDVGGENDLSLIDPHNIEKIEIVKGAQSALYGSDAMAGVINIITKKHREQGVYADNITRYGTHNDLRQHNSVVLRFGQFSSQTNFQLQRSDGWQNTTEEYAEATVLTDSKNMTVNKFRNWQIAERMTWEPMKNLELYAEGSYYKKNIMRPQDGKHASCDVYTYDLRYNNAAASLGGKWYPQGTKDVITLDVDWNKHAYYYDYTARHYDYVLLEGEEYGEQNGEWFSVAMLPGQSKLQSDQQRVMAQLKGYLLHAIGAAKYSKIYVQSLQVIPGEEFAAVVASVKKFMNNGYIGSAHLDDAYLAKLASDEAIFFGMPLLNDPDLDIPTVATELNKLYAAEAAQGVVAFMGHGNPDNYDTFKANVRYTQLEEALQALNPNYFVGTVDMADNMKMDVLDRMGQKGILDGKMFLHCLMSIAGDHAHNDMAGKGDEFWKPMAPDHESVSWYEFFSHKDYDVTVPVTNQHPLGLLELPGVLNVWIQHTKNAEFLEDAYHSMYPEE